MMRARFLFSLILSVVLAEVSLVSAHAEVPQEGRVGCPHCKNDGTPISQKLQKADELYAAFNSKGALKELQSVLQMDPQNHEALSKTSRVYVDFGDMIQESGQDWQAKKLTQYRIAEDYARKAIKADPNSTWGYFYTAVSLAKIASLSPVSKQIDLSEAIRDAVEKAIALDPKNAYAYAVYGIWHRRMAEIGQMKRVFASLVWHSLPQGSLEKSVEYLKKSISLDPTIILSYLELGRSYIDTDQWEPARRSLKTALDLPVQFSDDAANKKAAKQLLEEIKDR